MRAGPVIPVAAALLAALAARWLYGARALDPREIGWLLHGDPAQHYLGSVFFRAEAWQWPLGLVTRFGEPATSVVFTDSIPLLALATKALGVAPDLQYFGLWMLACHVLAALFGVLLLRRLGARELAAFAGGLLLAFTPAMLMRAYGHEALMAHWLVLVALWLGLGRWRWSGWLALGVVALLVHPYLAAMVGALGLAAGIVALARGELRLLSLLAGGVAAVVLAAGLAWQAGYFIPGPERSAWGFGIYSANLLTWFDPMDWQAFLRTWSRNPIHAGEWSRAFPALPQATDGQYEGFAWLGAGGVVLVGLAVLGWVFGIQGAAAPVVPGVAGGTSGMAGTPDRARLVGLAAACLVMALFALSSRPSLGALVLAELQLPTQLERLAGVFRASGRFVWPLTLLLLAWAIARVGAGRRGAWLVVAAVLLQTWDIQDKLSEFRHRFRSAPAEAVAPPADPRWAEVFSRCPRLVFVSGEAGASGDSHSDWIVPTLAAARAGATVASAPTARLSADAAQRARDTAAALRAGQGWRSDTVYLLAPSLEPEALAALQAAPGVAGLYLQALQADGHQLVVAGACRP